MSNQWEVVGGKSKKVRTVEKKLSQTERKKILENGPKLEEILPHHQVKSLFANVKKGNKENNKPQINTNKVSTPKKVVKTIETQKKPPPAKAKNMETALSNLSASDLEHLLESTKLNFKDNQILWLTTISSYLNQNINYEADPIFTGKSYKYPVMLLSNNIKLVIMSTLKSVDLVNVYHFYDTLLANVAESMFKNQANLGSKIFLQMIAQEWPQVCCNSLARSVILRVSYQNRSQIGLSILWALGQGGYYDLTVGVKVWQNIMAPILEMRSYSNFVCEYIETILKSSNEKARIDLTQDEFFTIYYTLTSKSNIGLPKDCQKMLTESASLFLKKYIQSAPKVSYVFLNLFKNIEHLPKNQLELSACLDCLLKSTDCLKIWRMNYKKNISPSLLLLKHLDSELDNVSTKFSGSLELKDFLNDLIQLTHDVQLKKNSDQLEEMLELLKMLWTDSEGESLSSDFLIMEESNDSLSGESYENYFKVVQEKTTLKRKSTTKTSSSLCPCTCIFFLLIAAVGGLIGFDYHLSDQVFVKSVTGKLLKDTGTLPYVEVAWYKSLATGARGYKWMENNVPIYYEQGTVIAKPYVDLTKDLIKTGGNVACNIWESTKEVVEKKTPVVVEFIEQYAPGLPKKVQELSVSAWSTSVSAYHNSCDFFKTKVFIGSLSPENLGKALNQTQVAAARYYSWFHEKVNAYAQIK